jgi:alpha-D-ribose 1-methylphosphonate 5-phosphate C-P lyase
LTISDQPQIPTAHSPLPTHRSYAFGLLDEAAKKEVRRSCLKAVCIPGYQVPFASREMPIARGFGTGGLQITLALIGATDTLKVIDQGSDDSVNAVSLRDLVQKVCPGTQTTEETERATILQSRHRIPETPLREGQILVLQVPYPDALGVVEPNEQARVVMHGEKDYAGLYVYLYEDVVRSRKITLSAGYPTEINTQYIMTPSPIPRWDLPLLHQSRCLTLLGAGREKKIFAVPPYTVSRPLEFEDMRFHVETFETNAGERKVCARCGSHDTFLDEIYQADGETVFICNDTEYCARQQREQREGTATNVGVADNHHGAQNGGGA